MNEDRLTHLSFYDDNTETFPLNSVIEYITSAKHFNDPLIL